jgi:hypothetical protein
MLWKDYSVCFSFKIRNADKEDLIEKNKNKKCSKVRWLAQANA